MIGGVPAAILNQEHEGQNPRAVRIWIPDFLEFSGHPWTDFPI